MTIEHDAHVHHEGLWYFWRFSFIKEKFLVCALEFELITTIIFIGMQIYHLHQVNICGPTCLRYVYSWRFIFCKSLIYSLKRGFGISQSLFKLPENFSMSKLPK